MAAPQLPVAELRAVFGDETLDARAVRAEQIYDPVASASSGIWRVTARDRTAVLKVVRHSDQGHPNWQSGADVAHWYYWRREVCAYESGLLASLPGGLRAPQCHLIARRDDESVALWLEDLAGAPGIGWPLARYRTGARHLAQTQGGFVTDRALPDEPWLSRCWLRSYLRQRDGDLELVTDTTLWAHPLIASWFPSPPIERVQAMRADQDVFLAVLDELPRTLCHLDLHPANLFADGDEQTVAIDWSFVGIGTIGEDAGNLVPDAVLDFHVAPADIDDLYETVVAGYAAGLRDAGVNDATSVARLGMAATIAAKYAWIAPAMLRAVAQEQPSLNRRPIGETLQWWAPTVAFLLDRADEARTLGVP